MPTSLNRRQFARALLDQLGIQRSDGAVQALVGLERAEGGHFNNSAKFNPLNTTLDLPGSGDTGSQGNISVYRDWRQGLKATRKTLELPAYAAIRQALKAGNPQAVARAWDQSPWGTHGSLVYSAIASAPKHAGRVNGASVQGLGGASPTQGGGRQLRSAIAGASQGQAITASQSTLTPLLESLSRPAQHAGGGGLAAPGFSAAPKLAGAQAASLLSGAPQARPTVDASALVQSAKAATAALGGSQGRPGHKVKGTMATMESGAGKVAKGAFVKGAEHGSPIPGEAHAAPTHDTAGLAGYPAFDYLAKPGTTVVAPVSGKVVKLSGRDPKFGAYEGAGGPLGWSVYIEGNNGHTYYLTHMGSRDVKVGQTIKAGQEIGTVANYDKYGRPSHIHMGVH